MTRRDHARPAPPPRSVSPIAVGAGRRPTRWIGRWMMAVGAWHTAFGLWWFAVPLHRLVRAGWWNAVGWSADGRALAFWFLVAGALAVLSGTLLDDAELQDRTIPRSFGWGLVALALAGSAAVPVSGFWLLLAPGLGVLRVHARGRRPEAPLPPA